MVSQELTELGEGTVEYKNSKEMPDSGSGAWTSYSLKTADETWYSCN